MSNKLPNYLRTYRKRSGFSQADVAFLIGSGTRTKVSRFERFDRLPGLEAVLALEIIFQTPCKSLFEGIYSNVEQRTHERAQILIRRLKEAPPSPVAAYKATFLERVLGSNGSSLSDDFPRI